MKEVKSMESWTRRVFQPFFDRVADAFAKAGIKANTVTLFGLAGGFVAAVLIALGKHFWGGILLAFMAPMDAFDGTLARRSGELQPFGAFLDSVSDRYEEVFIFGALVFYYHTQANLIATLLALLALCGALLVSYTRAKAEAMGFNAKVGVGTRVERMIIIVLGLISGYAVPAIGIIAFLSHVTAIQRILTVYKQSGKRN
jgi:CDP-diacylglycerol--glycerol-3-phosphate 3-phosphatidyltransferase